MIGASAPPFELQRWLQGEPIDPAGDSGKVILAEVFQVNCPGCFVHALPEVLELHRRYADQGLAVIGIATAFEDFEHNTEANLEMLLEHGRLQGAPLQQLGKAGLLDGDRLDYRLEFPVAMDAMIETAPDTSPETVRAFILEQLPDFDRMSEDDRAIVTQRARDYLASRTRLPVTFSRYRLQGTPSSILIDRDGLLHDVGFGWTHHLEPLIQKLL